MARPRISDWIREYGTQRVTACQKPGRALRIQDQLGDLLEQHFVFIGKGEEGSEHGAEGQEHQLKEQQACNMHTLSATSNDICWCLPLLYLDSLHRAHAHTWIH